MTSEDKALNEQVIFIRLLNGDPAQEIAKDLDVTVATVTRASNKLKQAKEEDKLNQLLDMPNYALDKLAQEAKHLDLPPEILPAAQEAIGDLVDGVKGLQRLEEGFQDTAMYLNHKIKTMARVTETVGELNELVDAMCKLQNAFFGKGTTVQFNTQFNSGDSSYGEFLGDAPGSVNN